MTTAQSAKLIGTTAVFNVEGLAVNVTISDIKHAYGKTRYLIRPVAGDGEKWADSDRVIVGKGE